MLLGIRQARMRRAAHSRTADKQTNPRLIGRKVLPIAQT